jgi:magnesium transporter
MIVNCVAYQDGRKVADIPPEAISDYVGRPGHLVWVALRDPEEAELRTMQEEFGLHELAVEDALKGNQRAKVEEYGDTLFVVANTVEVVEGELVVGEVDIFVGPAYVLSVRTRASQGFVSVRERAQREPELLRLGSGFVLYALLDAVVDRYFPVVDALEAELEAAEDLIFTGAPARANVEALYHLKRRATALQHAARPLLEATGKLHGGRVPQACGGLGDYFRDVHDHLQRINQDIDAMRDTVSTAVSVNLSLISLQENETTKRLAAYAALIAIPTLVAGIYGMNFQHMPEITWVLGYPLALAIMAGIDLWLFFRFRKAGWL